MIVTLVWLGIFVLCFPFCKMVVDASKWYDDTRRYR